MFVVHRDRFFLSRFSHVAKYCNASWVAVSSSRAAASTTRFFRAPSFLVVKSYHHWPTRGVVSCPCMVYSVVREGAYSLLRMFSSVSFRVGPL